MSNNINSESALGISSWESIQSNPVEYNRIFNRNADALDSFLPKAQEIFKSVKEDLVQAIVDLELKFNKSLSPEEYRADNLKYTQEEIDNAYNKVSNDTLIAIRDYISGVKIIGDKVMEKEKDTVTASPYKGFNVSYKKVPFDAVGLYVPAGQVPLPIVSGMLVQSAVCAGVPRIIVCFPPTPYDAEILVAANEAFKDAKYPCELEIYRIGGCQAIAAMSQGVGMKPVNFIAGPGSIPVQAGKKIAQLQGTGVDAIGGPSEQMVLLEAGASPEAIIMAARDMVNETEHGETSAAVLVTNSDDIAKQVQRCINKFLEKEDRKEVIKQSFLKASAIIVTQTVDEMVEIAKRYGAEHIGLYMNNPAQFASRVNAPSVSLNDIQQDKWAMTTARANYGGTYHCTLPTGIYSGNQRGGTTPDMFCKTVEVMDIENNTGGYDTMNNLATCEKLSAHKRSLETTQILNNENVDNPELNTLIAEMKKYLLS